MSTSENSVARIAVLVATYNGGKWVEAQVSSIMRQTGVRVELLLGDDSSTDDTVAVLETLIRPQDKILPPCDRLGSAARNFFRLLKQVDASKYDYVALSDQDDLWSPDRLQRGVDVLRAHAADAYSSSVEAFWEDGRKRIIKKDDPQTKWDHIFEGGGPGCTFILTQPVVLELQSSLAIKDMRLESLVGDCHDWFIYSFARRRGYRWWIDSYPGVRYRQHATNAIGANVGWRASVIRWQRLRNGWYRARVLAVSELCRLEEPWPVIRMRRFSFLDRVILGLNVFRFRRRFRDAVILGASLVVPSSNRQSQ